MVASSSQMVQPDTAGPQRLASPSPCAEVLAYRGGSSRNSPDPSSIDFVSVSFLSSFPHHPYLGFVWVHSLGQDTGNMDGKT